MIVSRNVNRRDLRAELPKIAALAGELGCTQILFNLFTIDDRKGNRPNKRAILGQKVKSAILESGDLEKYGTLQVEWWDRRRRKPSIFHRAFARSSEHPSKKQKLVDEFPMRCRNGQALLICGESNIITIKRGRRKRVADEYGFLKLLDKHCVKVIYLPLHSYMRRYEMKIKRQTMSAKGRTVISVWCTGTKGESKVPWNVFKNKRDITGKVREVQHKIRKDLRIGIIEV